jgi:hypothetical protein
MTLRQSASKAKKAGFMTSAIAAVGVLAALPAQAAPMPSGYSPPNPDVYPIFIQAYDGLTIAGADQQCTLKGNDGVAEGVYTTYYCWLIPAPPGQDGGIAELWVNLS